MTTTRAQFPKEASKDGAFRRQASAFRGEVRADPDAKHPAAPGRYHLYVSSACPWAHRTILVRKLKGLEDTIGMTIVDPLRDERGWAFTDQPDPVNGFRFLAEAYAASDPDFDGRVTVPVLWDQVRGEIVSNESSDILRMLDTAFAEWASEGPTLYPEELRAEIDALNERIYDTVNNGVYRAGFATTQAAYEAAVVPLFESLAWLDEHLCDRRYLTGDVPTEADWRLFTTLVRFDPVYHGHFKCNLQRLSDFPDLWAYVRDLYQLPGVAETVDLDHIKRHYYVTHAAINPTRVVPLGPELDFLAPHDRARLAT